ncbi:U6 snRNA-associated Sm-like protein LSm7 [Violaceomyces palustris]|uniref:U6 snRNA-associated Sm-like protein LSm7 n=1 Tax=Violaceomyces palustris TaxID=1673888 RepID=A0ACD0NL49_9BASI|nr:U6 snRNA-associated Sm-like protein LSm7 [Violaceomyces palustris]
MDDQGRGSSRGFSSRGGGGGGGRGGANQRGGGGRGGRGGGRGGGGPSTSNPSGAERPKKEAILDLAKYVDKKVRVKFAGGREVLGILKGYDQLMNLVMDEVEEVLRDPSTGELTEKTRALGLAILRGTALTVINPADGFEQIANPFAQQE